MKASYSTRVNAGMHLETGNFTYSQNDRFLFSITITSKNKEGTNRRNRTQIINSSIDCMKRQIRGLEIAMERRRPQLFNKCRRLEAIVKRIKRLNNIEH